MGSEKGNVNIRRKVRRLHVIEKTSSVRCAPTPRIPAAESRATLDPTRAEARLTWAGVPRMPGREVDSRESDEEADRDRRRCSRAGLDNCDSRRRRAGAAG